MYVKSLCDDFVDTVTELYARNHVSLHEPIFVGEEKELLNQAIDSSFVSYQGKQVTDFEAELRRFTGSKFAISTVSGTAALHLGLLAAGVKPGHEVITQALTFVATANSISYCGASPVFLDIDNDTLGLSPEALSNFLTENAQYKNGKTYNKLTGRQISCVVPMHTFGLPSKIVEIRKICDKFDLKLVEDSAEALGSYFERKHLGRFGQMGIFSFNANKIITCGGGGMVVTEDMKTFEHLSHISKTSKTSHQYEFFHDSIGYNYRMPNINACLGLAQIRQLPKYLEIKRELFQYWSKFFLKYDLTTKGPVGKEVSNHWIIPVEFPKPEDRVAFLENTNKRKIGTRPVWTLMTKLPMYKNCYNDGLVNSLKAENHLVCIPSGVPSAKMTSR